MQRYLTVVTHTDTISILALTWLVHHRTGLRTFTFCTHSHAYRYHHGLLPTTCPTSGSRFIPAVTLCSRVGCLPAAHLEQQHMGGRFGLPCGLLRDWVRDLPAGWLLPGVACHAPPPPPPTTAFFLLYLPRSAFTFATRSVTCIRYNTALHITAGSTYHTHILDYPAFHYTPFRTRVPQHLTLPCLLRLPLHTHTRGSHHYLPPFTPPHSTPAFTYTPTYHTAHPPPAHTCPHWRTCLCPAHAFYTPHYTRPFYTHTTATRWILPVCAGYLPLFLPAIVTRTPT